MPFSSNFVIGLLSIFLNLAHCNQLIQEFALDSLLFLISSPRFIHADRSLIIVKELDWSEISLDYLRIKERYHFWEGNENLQ